MRRVSGPLLDRIDVRVEMGRVSAAELLDEEVPEDSETVASRIAAARSRALERNGKPNGLLTGIEAVEAAQLRKPAKDCLEELASRALLSGRGIHRVLRVARTICDLAGEDGVDEVSILAAATLREPGAGVARSPGG